MTSANKSVINLISTLDRNVRCSICDSYINKPVKNICGHRYCHECVYAAKNTRSKAKNKYKINECPQCSSRLKFVIEDVKFLDVSKKVQTLIPLLGLNITPDKSISENDKTKEKPNRLKRVLQELLSDIEAADSESYDEDDFNDFDNSALKVPGRKYLRSNDSGSKRSVRRKSAATGSKTKNEVNTSATKNEQASVKKNDNKSVKKNKQEEAKKKLSSSSISNEQDLERELSPFPASFLNKFSRQSDSNVNKRNENCGNITDIDKMKNKLTDSGHDLNDNRLNDNVDDNLLHYKFANKTYSKFDRLIQNCKCTSTQTDDKEKMSEKKEQINKEQQTDGTNNSDLYSTLSDLFNCLCTKHGVVGSIEVESIGRFEIKLSKSLPQKFGENDDKVDQFNDIPQSQVSLYYNQETQTDYINGDNLEKAMVDQSINTDLLSLSFNCTQTDLDHFVGVGKEERLDKINEVKACSQKRYAQDNLVVNIDEGRAVDSNLQAIASNQIIVSENEQSIANREEGSLNNNLEGIVSNQEEETQLHLDQAINVDEAKQVNEDGEDIPSSQKLFSQFSFSSKANLSFDFSQVLEFKDDQATQAYSQSETDPKPETIKDGKGEESSPKRSSEQADKSSSKVNESKSDIVMESDEDDDFLMRCVFESLNDNDEDINDIESIHSNSPKSSPVKVKVKSAQKSKPALTKAKSVEKSKTRGSKLRLRI